MLRLSALAFAAFFIGMPSAQAGFIASAKGIPAPPIVAKHSTRIEPQQPLLAAVPDNESSEASSASYEIVNDNSSDHQTRFTVTPIGYGLAVAHDDHGFATSGSSGGPPYQGTGGYDNFSGYPVYYNTVAEYNYHTTGEPSRYNGAPYNNFRGYDNTSGYNGNTWINSAPGYRGGYRY